jgi:hypothetical protein
MTHPVEMRLAGVAHLGATCRPLDEHRDDEEQFFGLSCRLCG